MIAMPIAVGRSQQAEPPAEMIKLCCVIQLENLSLSIPREFPCGIS